MVQHDGKYIPILLNCVYPSVILKTNDYDEDDSDNNDIYNLFSTNPMDIESDNDIRYNEHIFCDYNSDDTADKSTVSIDSEIDYDDDSTDSDGTDSDNTPSL